MKGSKVVSIFRDGNITIPIFLFKHYKKWNITLEEFLFLMYFYHLGDRFLFNPQEFSNQLGMELSEVMEKVDSLTSKGLIRVEVSKNEKGFMEEIVLLDDFFQKLSYLVMDEGEEKVDSNVYELIEKEFGRTLSPMEYEIIKAWLDNHMSEDLIKEAVKEATFNGVSNLRYIDKILYEWGKSGIQSVEDVEKRRKKHSKKGKEEPVDIQMVDWDWLDDDE